MLSNIELIQEIILSRLIRPNPYWAYWGGGLARDIYNESVTSAPALIQGFTNWFWHNGRSILFTLEDLTRWFGPEVLIENGVTIDGENLHYTDRWGNQHWCKGFIEHRKDGPAVIDKDGRTQWFIDGKRHRKDGPAVTWASGAEEWWLNGKRHRTGGPAWTTSDGCQSWWQQGLLHNEDGPAVLTASGYEHWHRVGKRHRLDGPAIYVPGHQTKWFVDGEEVLAPAQ